MVGVYFPWFVFSRHTTEGWLSDTIDIGERIKKSSSHGSPPPKSASPIPFGVLSSAAEFYFKPILRSQPILLKTIFL
jgi:hypothetical protein